MNNKMIQLIILLLAVTICFSDGLCSRSIIKASIFNGYKIKKDSTDSLVVMIKAKNDYIISSSFDSLNSDEVHKFLRYYIGDSKDSILPSLYDVDDSCIKFINPFTNSTRLEVHNIKDLKSNVLSKFYKIGLYSFWPSSRNDYFSGFILYLEGTKFIVRNEIEYIEVEMGLNSSISIPCSKLNLDIFQNAEKSIYRFQDGSLYINDTIFNVLHVLDVIQERIYYIKSDSSERFIGVNNLGCWFYNRHGRIFICRNYDSEILKKVPKKVEDNNNKLLAKSFVMNKTGLYKGVFDLHTNKMYIYKVFGVF